MAVPKVQFKFFKKFEKVGLNRDMAQHAQPRYN